MASCSYTYYITYFVVKASVDLVEFKSRYIGNLPLQECIRFSLIESDSNKLDYQLKRWIDNVLSTNNNMTNLSSFYIVKSYDDYSHILSILLYN